MDGLLIWIGVAASVAAVALIAGVAIVLRMAHLGDELKDRIQTEMETLGKRLSAGLSPVSTSLGTLQELVKAAERALDARIADTAERTFLVAAQVQQAFLDAEGGFRRLADGLKDLSTLDEIKLRVDQITSTLVAAHQEIGSQLATAGRIQSDLHALVARWSEEGTRLQASYERLAATVELALTRDVGARERATAQLESLLVHHARGDGQVAAR